MGRIRMKTKLGVAIAAGAIIANHAGAAPDLFRTLPQEARDLSQLKWEKRPVLLFAPTPQDPAYNRQIDLFAAAEDALAERDIVVLSDTDAKAPSHLRQGFQPGGFKLVLVGKDGGVKLERDGVVTPDELFAIIDRMPMRRREMAD